MARVGFLSRPSGLNTSPQPSSFPSLKIAALLVKIFVLLKFVGAGVVGSLFSGLHEEFCRGCEVRGFGAPRGGVRAV